LTTRAPGPQLIKRPKRGEVWLVDLEPIRGAELNKVRPAVVISSDAIGVLPIKLVAPITSWKPYMERNIWHIRLMPDALNSLDNESAVDALQIRSLALERFQTRLGRLSADTMEEIAAAVAVVIEYS
jgi:mRNA interferase MazF